MVDRRAQVSGQKTREHIGGFGLELNARGDFGILGGFLGGRSNDSLGIDRQNDFLTEHLLGRVLAVVVHQNDLVDGAFLIRLDSVIGDLARLFKRRIGGEVLEIKNRRHAAEFEEATGLLATGDNVHLDTLRLFRANRLLDGAQDVRVKAACEAAVGNHGHTQDTLYALTLFQQGVLAGLHARRDALQHLGHGVGVRSRGLNTLGGIFDLRASDHFHGARNLLRRRNRLDALFNVVQVRHVGPSLRHELRLESVDSGIERSFAFRGEFRIVVNLLQDVSVACAQELDELVVPV